MTLSAQGKRNAAERHDGRSHCPHACPPYYTSRPINNIDYPALRGAAVRFIANCPQHTKNASGDNLSRSRWCHQESNRGHKDFQSFALPTELWHHRFALLRCFSSALSLSPVCECKGTAFFVTAKLFCEILSKIPCFYSFSRKPTLQKLRNKTHFSPYRHAASPGLSRQIRCHRASRVRLRGQDE